MRRWRSIPDQCVSRSNESSLQAALLGASAKSVAVSGLAPPTEVPEESDPGEDNDDQNDHPPQRRTETATTAAASQCEHVHAQPLVERLECQVGADGTASADIPGA